MTQRINQTFLSDGEKETMLVEMQSANTQLEQASLKFLTTLRKNPKLGSYPDSIIEICSTFSSLGHHDEVVELILPIYTDTVKTFYFLHRSWNKITPETKKQVLTWLQTQECPRFEQIIESLKKKKNKDWTHREESYLTAFEYLLSIMAADFPQEIAAILQNLAPQFLPFLEDACAAVMIQDLQLGAQIYQIPIDRHAPEHPHWKLWKDALDIMVNSFLYEEDETENEQYAHTRSQLTEYLLQPNRPLSAGDIIDTQIFYFLLEEEPKEILWLLQNRKNKIKKHFRDIVSIFESILETTASQEEDASQRDEIQKTVVELCSIYYEEIPENTRSARFLLKHGDPRLALQILPTLSKLDWQYISLAQALCEAGYSHMVATHFLSTYPPRSFVPEKSHDLNSLTFIFSYLEKTQQERYFTHLMNTMAQWEEYQYTFYLLLTTFIKLGFAKRIVDNFEHSSPISLLKPEIFVLIAKQCVLQEPALKQPIAALAQSSGLEYQQEFDRAFTPRLQDLTVTFEKEEQQCIKDILYYVTDLFEKIKEISDTARLKQSFLQDFPELLELSLSLLQYREKIQQDLEKLSLAELLFLRRILSEEGLFELNRVQNGKRAKIQLGKTGSSAEVWLNGVVVNSILKTHLDVWQYVHDVLNVPVAPILKTYTPEQATPQSPIRVRSRFCDITLSYMLDFPDMWFSSGTSSQSSQKSSYHINLPFSLFSEIMKQKAAIFDILEKHHIEHGHPHDGNFTLEFIRKDVCEQFAHKINEVPYDANSVMSDVLRYLQNPEEWQPVVRLIDWDRATQKK